MEVPNYMPARDPSEKEIGQLKSASFALDKGLTTARISFVSNIRFSYPRFVTPSITCPISRVEQTLSCRSRKNVTQLLWSALTIHPWRKPCFFGNAPYCSDSSVG